MPLFLHVNSGLSTISAGWRMADLAVIERLERAALWAWPPKETARDDGWLLRAGGGRTRRVNSVQALVFPAATDVQRTIDRHDRVGDRVHVAEVAADQMRHRHVAARRALGRDVGRERGRVEVECPIDLRVVRRAPHRVGDAPPALKACLLHLTSSSNPHATRDRDRARQLLQRDSDRQGSALGHRHLHRHRLGRHDPAGAALGAHRADRGSADVSDAEQRRGDVHLKRDRRERQLCLHLDRRELQRVELQHRSPGRSILLQPVLQGQRRRHERAVSAGNLGDRELLQSDDDHRHEQLTAKPGSPYFAARSTLPSAV